MVIQSNMSLSATDMEIYDSYHQLWKIEESFMVMKTYLEARPVYLQTKESIYGHFLIVFLDLLVLRLLELKEFDNQLCVGEIIFPPINASPQMLFRLGFCSTEQFFEHYPKLKTVL